MELVVRPLPAEALEGEVEVVEHKGIGHPDTMCDGLAEAFGVALARFYLERFGRVLHHNVDKALLVGGASRPELGGGEIVVPMHVMLGGRATRRVRGVEVPVDEIARAAGRAWVKERMHALDPDRHVTWSCVALGGSADLVDLFGRSVPLANDTSIGVGFAPLSRLERAVLAAAGRLRAMSRERPEIGEDVKIMGERRGARTRLTVCCAMIGAHLATVQAYAEARDAAARAVAQAAGQVLGDEPVVEVNAGDDPPSGRIYLTVTGTSAEAGDDGQVGRGNRVSGLITPYRPMSIEAAAGKNPVSHVGKLYNVVAGRIARDIVEKLEIVAAAECFLVSRIGRPVSDPSLGDVRLRLRGGAPLDSVQRAVVDIVRSHLENLNALSAELLAGSARVF